jgi:serine/threonine-protein kinase
MDPTPRLLDNRYELLTPIATGGMGRVWRARDTLLQRPVAVKVLKSEFSGDPTFRARFRAEAQHTAVLTHPNIASVFDYGEAEVDGEQTAYLVMELVEGEPLSTLLLRERRLDAGRTLGIVRQTAAALAAAHAAGVVHRDVKPGNVLVAPDGQVKITDFGIAWSASSVPLTGTGQVIGTAHYLSPEQAQGGKASPASDVYALGAVMYECLAGRRPIEGENSVQIAVNQIREEPPPLPADVPPAVQQVVAHAMAKDPARRYPDGAALRDAVDAVATGMPTAPVGAGHATVPVAGAPAPIRRTESGTAVMPLPPMGAGPRTTAAPPPPLPPSMRPRPGRPAPAPRGSGRRAALALVLGALAVALLVVVAAVVLRPAGSGGGQSGSSGSSSGSSASSQAPPTSAESSAPSTSAAQPSTVTVAADSYVGRPVDEVQAELTALGLQVTTTPVQTGDAENGVVTAVSPTGELAPGSAVTVSYAVPPPADQGNGDNGHGKGHKKHGHG